MPVERENRNQVEPIMLFRSNEGKRVKLPLDQYSYSS
jgi:hypothetical protein